MSSSKRTILIVTPYFPPNGGGLERYALQIAQRLQSGHDWRVVMVASGAHLGKDTKRSVSGMTVYQLGYSLKLSNTPFGLLWKRKLTRIIAVEKPDVINAHAPVPGMADAAAAAAGHTPFVLTYHNGSIRKGSFWPDLLIRAYESTGLRKLFSRADQIIASSEYVRDEIRPVRQTPAHVITPGVDTGIFAPPAEGSPKRRGLLFVANYGASYGHKGLSDAIRALSLIADTFPDLTLTVVGQGDAKPYMQLASQLGVAKRLHFVPMQDSLSLARYYQRSAVMVLPSTMESFGMVLVEAMACGLPVAATTAGGIPTVVDDGRTGLLTPPGDYKALSGSIQRILSDQQLAGQLAEAGQRAATTQYDWDSKAAQTNDLLDSLLQPHVCQVSAYYPPHIGGLENVVQELSRTLAARGYTVDVLTSLHPAGSPLVTQEPGIQIHRLPGFEFLSTPVMFGLLRRIYRQPKGTIVHLHVSQALVPEITWLAAKLRGMPLVSHVHLDVEPSSAIGNVIFPIYKRTLLKFVLRHSDRVIALSSDQRELLIRKYGLTPGRVEILSNGVGASYFLPARSKFHDPLRIVYVGRLALQKRPERIVEAMADLPHAHLTVIGDGDARPALEEYVRAHKLTNVTFNGALWGSDLLAGYREADVLVLPSDREGMPLVLLEAMASSLPIVASDVLGIRELIRGIGVLVPDPSAANFAAALSDLGQDHRKLAQLSSRSQQAGKTYSWEHSTTSLVKLYGELA